ncbi:hypothetical protein [Methylobacterium sp. CCH5-D2]|uniref:helix-turn-helix transcriptional regulator n=1 Tax=Methylobacterium sp. CCH5-D2 TaxID=1768765 RepID=UPI00082EC6F3|nr:hypothetical protein [Methylobacterium sp. CCH5-D2]
MAKARSEASLPAVMPITPPRGLSRLESARHIGVSATFFDQMVRDGRMPQPKRVGARVIWDRVKLEAYFEALPEEAEVDAPGRGWEDWR